MMMMKMKVPRREECVGAEVVLVAIQGELCNGYVGGNGDEARNVRGGSANDTGDARLVVCNKHSRSPIHGNDV
jgi:hypothetical protein